MKNRSITWVSENVVREKISILCVLWNIMMVERSHKGRLLKSPSSLFGFPFAEPIGAAVSSGVLFGALFNNPVSLSEIFGSSFEH